MASLLPSAIKHDGGYDIHLVDPRDPASLALLKLAYDGVYTDSFPIAAEREALANWHQGLNGAKRGLDLRIIITGNHFCGANPKIKGLTACYYYKNHDVGLLAYIAVAVAARGEGLGKMLMQQAGRDLVKQANSYHQRLQGFFLECNDPTKVSAAKDSFDPATRLKIFTSWGAREIPITYVQPPLDHGMDACDCLKLLAYPHPVTGQYPNNKAVAGFLTGIYTELADYTGCAPSDNPDYQRSIAQLAALGARDAPVVAANRQTAPTPKMP